MWWWEYIPTSELGPSRIAFPVSKPEQARPVSSFVDRETYERESATIQPSAPQNPGTLGESRVYGTPKGLIGTVGGLFGPVGKGVASLLNAVLPPTITIPSKNPAPGNTPEGDLAVGDAVGPLSEAQVRELARDAGRGDPTATRQLETWREEQRQESAERMARIESDLRSPEPVASVGDVPTAEILRDSGPTAADLSLPEGLDTGEDGPTSIGGRAGDV